MPKTFKITFMLLATLLLGNASATASADEESHDDLLIIGSRPWDPNIAGVQGLQGAHFMDFRDSGAPTPMPTNFHHIDFNDKQMYESGNLTDFAMANTGRFKTIMFDWITFQHVHNDRAWDNMAMLLQSDGLLIIPITGSNPRLIAEDLIKKLKHGPFSKIKIIDYKDVPMIKDDLYHHNRLGMTEAMITFNPVFIYATRGNIESATRNNIEYSDLIEYSDFED